MQNLNLSGLVHVRTDRDGFGLIWLAERAPVAPRSDLSSSAAGVDAALRYLKNQEKNNARDQSSQAEKSDTMIHRHALLDFGSSPSQTSYTAKS
jgi:hypothetical protein